MGRNFVCPDLDQPLLLPPDMRAWLPEDHLAHTVIDAVEQVDLGSFAAAYRVNGQGRAAVHPRVMVALLVYAYSVGVRSSREIERRCVTDVAFRVVSRDLRPDHATVARFRRRHEAALRVLFTEVLALLHQVGLVTVGVVVLDGTKIAADASWQANKTEARLEELVAAEQALIDARLAEVSAQMLADAGGIDAAEDQEFGVDRRGDELPPQLRRRGERRDRLVAARDRLAAQRAAARDAQEAKKVAWEQRKAEGKRPGRRPNDDPPVSRSGKPPRANTTDPDARSMRNRHDHDFLCGYNAQVWVNLNQIILDPWLTQNPIDQGLFGSDLDHLHDQLAAAGIRKRPYAAAADAGYSDENAFERAHHDRLLLLSPLAKDTHRATGDRPDNGRDLSKQPYTRAAQADLATPVGRTLYKQRGQTVEPVFGHLKTRHNLRRFNLRGLTACQSELYLAAAAHNLRKLHIHQRAARRTAG